MCKGPESVRDWERPEQQPLQLARGAPLRSAPTLVTLATPNHELRPMRTLPATWATLALLACGPGWAASYYVDAQAGSDRNSGLSPTSAWRTLDKVAAESRNRKLRKNGFVAGDQILFRRGQTFSSSAYPIVQVAGVAGNPVRLGAWGEGGLPRLDNHGSGVYELVLKIQGQYAELRELAIVKSNAANVTEYGLYLAGSGHRVESCDISGVGLGLKLEGSGHRVTANRFHDLTMVIADAAVDNDYGASGVVVHKASDIEIWNNRFERLRAPSPDYGVDGSALEIFNSASDVRFHHNVVDTTAALVEVGGSSATELVTGLRIHHNLVLEADSIGYFHNSAGSPYGVQVQDVKIEHNTFRKTGPEMHSWLLGFGLPPAAGQFFFRNNVVEHHHSNGLFFQAGLLVHEANLYALSNAPWGDASFVLSASEALGEPLFRNPALGDFRLQWGSWAIDRGLALGYGLDLDGLAMPVRTAPDLGAYEAR